MKICWDNLEKLKFIKRSGRFADKKRRQYEYRDTCAFCGEPFLIAIGGKNLGIFCSKECSQKSRILSEEERNRRYRIQYESYYAKNRVRILARQKNDRLRDPEAYWKKKHKYDLERRQVRLLAGARRRAKMRKWPFELDHEWFDYNLQKNCAMTGLAFDMLSKHTARVPSIDRKDSKQGYTKANCRLVLNVMNIWKMDYSEHELYEVAKAFVEKYENDRSSTHN